MSFIRRLTLRDPQLGEDRYVVVTGDDGRPWDEVVEELKAMAGGRDVVLRGKPLRSRVDATVEDLRLRDGEILTIGAKSRRAPAPPGGRVLRVVGGPDAGHTVALATKPVLVGRGSDAGLVIRDREISRVHARLEPASTGATISDRDSSNGTLVEGTAVSSASLPFGDVARVGSSLLEVAEAEEAVPLEDGSRTRGFSRTFRPGLEPIPKSVSFPRVPEERDTPPLNLLLTLAPGAAFAAIALLTNRPTLLIFAAISPLLGIFRTIAARRSHTKKAERDAAQYQEERAAAKAALDHARATERHVRRSAVPDPARIVEAALRPTRLLWSRKPDDEDVLSLRVGTATLPSEVAVDGTDEQGLAEPQPALPLPVSLQMYGGLAFVGSPDRGRRAATSAVLQAAVLHPPGELRVVLLADSGSEDTWSWMRWLPHCRREADDPFLRLGTDSSSRAERLAELTAELEARRERAKGRPVRFTPAVLVVVDDVSARLAEGAAELFRDGPTFGIHLLTVDREQMPEGCEASVRLGVHDDDATVERVGRPTISGVLVDGMSPALADRASRALATMELVSDTGGGRIPAACRLLDVIEVEPTADALERRWKKRSPRTSALIGEGAGRTISLDLTSDGPHFLVAGTTRAGKSEFIKTLAASLAAENHPDDLRMLFIDFKGGNDYQVLKQFPHCVTLVTSVDDDATMVRALRLLEAESARRQALIQGAQASKIEGYLRNKGVGDPPLPRLLVIADEFAEFKARQPRLMDKLVSVARTGAAFGIHLLLATQRPTGVVDAQIDSNVNTRLCFRVVNEEESRNIIGAPDAGRIEEHHRGRAFMRSGTQLTEVQTGLVFGPRPGSSSARPLTATEVPWHAVGKPPARVEVDLDVPAPETDLWDLMEAAAAAAERTGWTPSAVPWPADLPRTISLDHLKSFPEYPSAIVIGAMDEPQRQRRSPLAIRLGKGHVAFAGSQQTGRTTALRIVATQLARKLAPSDVAIAVVDFAGGGLRAAGNLPHCLGVASGDLEVCERLIRGLEKEVQQRQQQFAAGGWSDLAMQRERSDTPLPWLVLLIDGWDALVDDGVRMGMAERVAALLGRGASVGLQAVVAGDRGTASNPLAKTIAHRFVLRFNQTSDAERQGLTHNDVPRDMPPGRIVHVGTKQLGQLAQLDDPQELGQPSVFAEAVEEIGQMWAGTGQTGMARVEAIPNRVDLSALRGMGAAPEVGATPVLLGLNGDTGQPLWIDLGELGNRMFVVGPPRSGRSTLLSSIAASAVADGLRVHHVTPRGTTVPVDHPKLTVSDRVPEDLGGVAGADDRLLLLVDDLEDVEDPEPIAELLRDRSHNVAVIVAADLTTFRDELRGVYGALRKGKAGVILSPGHSTDGALIGGGRLSEAHLFDGPPGRGVFGSPTTRVIMQAPIAGEA